MLVGHRFVRFDNLDIETKKGKCFVLKAAMKLVAAFSLYVLFLM